MINFLLSFFFKQPKMPDNKTNSYYFCYYSYCHCGIIDMIVVIDSKLRPHAKLNIKKTPL